MKKGFNMFMFMDLFIAGLLLLAIESCCKLINEKH